MRWIMRAFPAFHHLVFWAGSIPEDLDYRPRLGYFSDKGLHFVYGNQDQFLTPERIAEQRELIQTAGLQLQEHTFDGKHTVEEEPLRRIARLVR
jgi:predicted esterase